MQRLLALLIPAVLTASIATASAQAPLEIEATKERTHSINASPLGLLLGSYNVNYEYLSGAHGVLGEVSLNNYSRDDADSLGAGVAVGYRWHWRGRQNSGFLGVNLGAALGSGDVTISENGEDKTFTVDSRVLSVTGNIGKRWAWDNGLNVTFRIGAGYGNYNITTESTDPDAKKATDEIDDLLTLLPVAIDGELSLGYSF